MITAALAAPVLLRFGYPFASMSLRMFFAAVCHQDPARSFALSSIPIAVCARCLGIYMGAVVGLLIRTERSVAIQGLAWLVVINLGSAVAEWAGMPVSNASRFIVGFGLGAAGSNLLSASLGNKGASIQIHFGEWARGLLTRTRIGPPGPDCR